MPGFISDSPLARDLIRIGDEAIAREDDAALRAYFSEDYVFHGPGGDLSFDQCARTSGPCAPLSVCDVREQIIVDGNPARAPRSPATSPGSLPTRPSVHSGLQGNTSSGE